MFRPAFPITTERLLLRPVAVDDAPAMARYQSQPDVCRFIPYEPRSAEQIAQRLQDPANARSELERAGQRLFLAVLRRSDGVLVGDVMLAWTSEEQRAGEIGYVFDPDQHGNGYATEAARALLRLGFEGLGLHRIVGLLDARNAASAAVLRRAGMRQEAHLVQNEWFKGEWTDELIFAMLESEWRDLFPA